MSEVGIRSVASIDGSNFWVAGKGVATSDQRLQYIPFGGSSGTSIIAPAVQSRHLSIVNGQLYNTDNGIQAVGVSLPTTGPVTLTTCCLLSPAERSIRACDQATSLL